MNLVFNKNEKALIIADSALELLITIQTKLTLLREIETTLVITERTNDSFRHYERLKELGLFDDVIYVNTNSFPKDRSYKKYSEPEKSRIFRDTCVLEARDVLKDHLNITIFFTSEVDYFSQYMYQSVRDTATPYIIGEGVYTFFGLEKSMMIEMEKRQVYLLEDLEGILFYGPKLGDVSGKPMREIPSINLNRLEYLDYVNRIFDYIPHKSMIRNKIIFFEESYSRDGGKDNAREIVKFLIKQYGKENVLVKKHPRSLEDRFSNLGVHAIEPFSIPWELFLLNRDCDECVLLSANSGSVYLSTLWDFCDTNVTSIMLSNIMDYEFINTSNYINYFSELQKLYIKYNIPVPNTLDEMGEEIKKTGYLT